MDSIVHFEIPYDDKERVGNFYKEVFGWNLEEMPEMNYVIARTTEVDEKKMPSKPGAINGGMYKRGGDSSKSPVLVLDVANIDQKLATLEQHGGKKVTEKITMGDIGYYMQVQDSEGNILGLWQHMAPQQPQQSPPPQEQPQTAQPSAGQPPTQPQTSQPPQQPEVPSLPEQPAQSSQPQQTQQPSA